MINTKSAISVFLLFLILPGCLARYGEERLKYLLDITEEWESPGEFSALTEDKIKVKLGKPGFLKPIYERNLELASGKTQKTLRDLNKDKGVALKHYPDGPDDLYDELSAEYGKLKNLKLLSYVYDRMGFEDPSLTFYIGSLEDGGRVIPRVFGWDYVKYGTETGFTCNGEKRTFINYDKIDGLADYLRLLYTLPVDTVIGLKQFAGEIIKSPLSFIEAEFIKNIFFERKIPFYKFDGFKAAREDWRNGVTALTYRHRVYGKQGILATTQNLLGEVPIIGSVFDQWIGKNSGTANKLFLTRGIYGGGDSAQNMALWADYLTNPPVQECPPDQSTRQSGSTTPEETNRVNTNNSFVKVIPYRYGSGIDVFWALLNISHGYAYEMASEIVLKCNVNPDESIYLSGHSGGVQRSIATARILNDDGIKVKKIDGIAGPALGYVPVPCKETRVVLNSKFGQDVVTETSRLLRYISLGLLTLNIDWEIDDRKARNNRKARNKDGEYYKHKTPGFVDGKTRLKYDGFLCDNFEYLFR
jgi:hypothetical protein